MKRSSTIRFGSEQGWRAGSILLEVSVSAFVLAIAVAGSSQYLTTALSSSEKNTADHSCRFDVRVKNCRSSRREECCCHFAGRSL